MPDAGTIPFRKADTNGHYKSLQLPNDAAEFMPALGLPAFAGDVVGPGGATVNQVAVFENATGKKIRAAVETGLAKLAGGVLSSVTAPVGEVVGTTDPQVLTNKTLTNPTITGLTGLTKNDVGLGNVDNTSDANKPVSGPQQAALNLKQDLAAKAAANGYASLDAAAKVPLSQIPDSVVGGQQYQGTWNAATNTPAIPTAVLGNKGWYYSVNVAGTTNINGISSWAVGDQIISNGSVWQKIANVSAVNSVNGYTGVVVLGKADVGLGNVDNTSDASKPVSTATATQLALKEDKANKGAANGYAGLDATGKVPAANVPADLVTSVAGKQGVVTLVKGDVGLGNVDNTSDATKNSASATLTNKTINGANNTLTVRLANDVTGNLPVTNLNAGTGANSGSFWRGDGQWAPPAGGGDVVGPAGGVVDGEVVSFNATTGKILKASAGKLTASLVEGPASVVSGDLASYSGTTGKLVTSIVRSGLTTDFLNGTNAYADLGAVVKSMIWSQRLRGYNAVGNPNFEVDQRSVGALVSGVATNQSVVDRWMVTKNGTMAISAQQLPVNVALPGTNFLVSSKVMRTTLTTAQGSLGASDYLGWSQVVEGCCTRELLNDVHSMSLLVRSSVANLKFSAVLSDVSNVWSLNKLCTMGAANTWTLITLPNMPAFAAGATWSSQPGVVGYNLYIYLAAGSGGVTTSPDVWLNTSKYGASGMSNFAGSAVNSTFDVAFVQHEPGAECTTLIDVPWSNNLLGCQRYFAKSYDYATAIGTPTSNGALVIPIVDIGALNYPDSPVKYPVSMAKLPVVTAWNPGVASQSGACQTSDTVSRSINGVSNVGTTYFGGFTIAGGSQPAGQRLAYVHYTADTGW